MKYLVWLTCFILTFGFSQQNDEQPPYIPPIEFGRKREADVQLEMVNRTIRINTSCLQQDSLERV